MVVKTQLRQRFTGLSRRSAWVWDEHILDFFSGPPLTRLEEAVLEVGRGFCRQVLTDARWYRPSGKKRRGELTRDSAKRSHYLHRRNRLASSAKEVREAKDAT
jgi:hypothetical protein